MVNTLPGIFGKEKVASEKKRLENVGQPLQQIPDGVQVLQTLLIQKTG
ncbi:MAG: hypothetical protein WDM90_06820 [Ferruginibacter sp.]